MSAKERFHRKSFALVQHGDSKCALIENSGGVMTACRRQLNDQTSHDQGTPNCLECMAALDLIRLSPQQMEAMGVVGSGIEITQSPDAEKVRIGQRLAWPKTLEALESKGMVVETAHEDGSRSWHRTTAGELWFKKRFAGI